MSEEGQPVRPYPGFWQGVWLFVQFLLLTSLAALPFYGLDQLNGSELESHPAVEALCGLLAIAWLVKQSGRRMELTEEEIAGPFLIRLTWLPPVAAVVIGQILIELPALILLTKPFPALAAPKTDYGVSVSVPGAFMGLVVAGPLAEELLFRGIILRGHLGRYGGPKGLAFRGWSLRGRPHLPLFDCRYLLQLASSTDSSRIGTGTSGLVCWRIR